MYSCVSNFVVNNPQVSAAIITALFSILGVFINILLNIHFRNKDYVEKNRINYIEIMETYYIPLQYHILSFKNKLNCFASDDLYFNIVQDSSSKNDEKRQNLKESIANIEEFISKNKHQYIGEYKLFEHQNRVINDIKMLKSCFELHGISREDVKSKKSVIDDIGAFLKSIEKRKTRLLSKNFISYLYNWYKLCIKNNY